MVPHSEGGSSVAVERKARAVTDGQHTNHGRWSEPGVPHKGWECIGVEDAKEDGGDMETCGMCLTAEIRYIHRMQHPEFPEILEVGCICAMKWRTIMSGRSCAKKS
jgi:hypothetical protein